MTNRLQGEDHFLPSEELDVVRPHVEGAQPVVDGHKGPVALLCQVNVKALERPEMKQEEIASLTCGSDG